MPEFETLSSERQAIIRLVVRHGRSYESVSEESAVPETMVRTLARDALVELAPLSASRVEPEWRERVADYVLGQQSGSQSSATRAYLRRSEEGRAWALLLLDALDPLYEDGGRPVIPLQRGRFLIPGLPALSGPPAEVLERPRVALRPPPSLRRLAESARELQRLSVVGPVLLALFAAALWFLTLEPIDLREVNDYGLVSVLPAGFFAALALLTLSFCLCLRRRPVSVPVLLLHLLVLIGILFATAPLIEEEPRFTAAWRHVGVAESIARTGEVNPDIDAYFNWPGFFIFTAFLTKVAGLDDSLVFLDWAPAFFNLLYLGPFLMIARSATTDRRLIWLGAWLFYLANWVGQDYYSPQAMGHFLYLVVLAILVTWFEAGRPGRIRARLRGSPLLASLETRLLGGARSAVPALAGTRPGQRIALIGVVILMFAATVPSHQLSPFAMLAGVTALVVTNQVRTRSLPVLMVIAIGTWVSFMTVSYLAGNLEELIGGVGKVQESATENVSGRIQGSVEHIAVVKLRLAMTAALWILAFLGALRLFRAGRGHLRYAVLASAPFPLLALQPYGGEMILRVYLFTLPFMAFFAAAFFFPSPRSGRSWIATGAIAATSLVIIAGFVVARYGNERSDAFRSEEVAAVQRLYALAEPNSMVIAGYGNLPWKYREYEQHDYRVVTETLGWQRLAASRGGTDGVVRDLWKVMRPAADHAYLIITRSDKAYIDLLGGAPPGSLTRLERALAESPRFDVVYSNPDGRIFMVADRERRSDERPGRS